MRRLKGWSQLDSFLSSGTSGEKGIEMDADARSTGFISFPTSPQLSFFLSDVGPALQVLEAGMIPKQETISLYF